MSIVKSTISVSLDGFVAGPDQSLENPLGIGGEGLHEWVFTTDYWKSMHGESGERGPDDDVLRRMHAGVGAHVMGRGMFGGGPGPWDESWTGWWGAEPPYHTPVYVLTHHERAPVEMDGGTTFHFCTDGVHATIERAREAAGDEDVLVAGGAQAIGQCLDAGLIDELTLSVVPVLLGGGARLLDEVGTHVELEPIEAVAGSGVSHITYRAR